MTIGLGLSKINDGPMVSIESPSPCANSINDYIVVFSDTAFRMVDGKSNFGHVMRLMPLFFLQECHMAQEFKEVETGAILHALSKRKEQGCSKVHIFF